MQPPERYASPDPMYAPASPRVANDGLLQRMNTIAPGPFDLRSRPSTSSNATPKGSMDGERPAPLTRSVTDSRIGEARRETEEMENAAATPIQRPSTAGSRRSKASMSSAHDRKMSLGAPHAPSRTERPGGYGGFGRRDEEASTSSADGEETPRPASRSQTFPRRIESRDRASIRRPSEPTPPASRDRTSSSAASTIRRPVDLSTSPPQLRRPSFPSTDRRPSLAGPDRSRPLPPRGASLISRRNDARLGDAPPVPNVNLAAEFGIGNPYHTPTESLSSAGSGFSEESGGSSRSSPPVSTAGGGRHRRGAPSDTSNIDLLMSEIQETMEVLQPKELPSTLAPLAVVVEPDQAALAPRRPSVVEQFPLPPSQVQQQQQQGGIRREVLPAAPLSPLDPAIQLPTARLPSPPPPRPAAVRRPTLNPPASGAPSKGNCKGCSQPIKGKSVSSADGRLSGRYHKSCFVCRTCSSPFLTSTFYVHDDAPYCERHYHQLNGSLCSACDRGIEGEYLCAEGGQKFHGGCLTCGDCRIVLKGGYFEMGGRVYCERDAWRRAQASRGRGRGTGRGGRGGALGVAERMERRTTRLMNM